MGLFNFILDNIAKNQIKKRLVNDPVYAAGIIGSSKALHETGLIKNLGKDTVEKWALSLHNEIENVVTDSNPVNKCRELLSNYVFYFAEYQVLVLDINNEYDPTELIGTQGVTGELKQHLSELVIKNKDFKKFFYSMRETPTKGDIWDFVLYEYWKGYWCQQTMNALRVALNDNNQVPERDWLRPFIHACCVFAEYNYRKELELPPAIKNDSGGLIPLIYSTFLDTVISGERFPDLAWREYYADSIHKGTLNPPFPKVTK